MISAVPSSRQRLRAKRVTIPVPALVIWPSVRSVCIMSRRLGQRTERPPPGPESAVKARGARASFVLRRLRSARLLPASLLLAILASTMVTVGLASFGASALPAAEHQRLANVPDATIQLSGQVGAARADADARVIRSSIASALGGVGFGMLSGRWSDQLTLPRSRGEIQAPLIQAAVLDDVAAHVQLTSGHWPGSPGQGQPIPVALPAGAAAMLHFALGQVLTLPDSLTGTRARLRVTGLYRPRDPAAPYWRLSLLGTSGQLVQGSFVTYGPMLVAPSALGPGGLTAGQASWLITVNTGQIAPGGTAALGQRLGAVVTNLQTRQDLGSLQAATPLPQTLTALGSGLVVARSLLLIGSLQLILLAVAAAALAARLLATQREGENSLLSARGVARGQLAFASFTEASLLTVAGVLAGTILGSYLAALLMSVSGLPYSASGGAVGLLGRGLSGGAWWPAAVIAVLVIAVVVRPALRPVTPGAARLRRGRQATLATAARAGLDVALLALGVVAFWELRRYSAAPRLSGGSLGVDPVLAVAPVLALAGLALLPLRALPAAARLLDRLSARGRRLTAALASWQVARRPVRQGGPILIVVLAVGTGTLVLAQHQSWRQSQLDQAAFATGADVRASLAAPLPLGRADQFGHAHGVLAAMPVSNFNSGFGVYALDARAAPGTVLLRPDLATLPPAALWRQLAPARPSPGLVLPGLPARLAVTVAVQPPRGIHLGALPVSLSVQDGWGIVYPVPAGSLPADGRYHLLIAGLTGPGQPSADQPAAGQAAAGQAAAGQAGRRGGARYPLRLLGLSLSYQMPGFPVPPSGPTPATKLTEARIAAARCHAARARPGGLRPFLRRLRGAVRRSRPAPRERPAGGARRVQRMAGHGGRRGARQPARVRGQARRQGVAAGHGHADLHRRHRAAHPEGRGGAVAGRRAGRAHRRAAGQPIARHRDPRVPRFRERPPRPGHPAAGGERHRAGAVGRCDSRVPVRRGRRGSGHRRPQLAGGRARRAVAAAGAGDRVVAAHRARQHAAPATGRQRDGIGRGGGRAAR